MPLGGEVWLGPGHILLDGDQAPLAKKGRSAAPNFRPMYRGQTAGWIKMPLATEVDLGPDDIVLDVDPALPKGHRPPPNFWPMSVVAKRLDGSRCHLVWR